MRSGSATEVPPYFWTTRLTSAPVARLLTKSRYRIPFPPVPSPDKRQRKKAGRQARQQAMQSYQRRRARRRGLVTAVVLAAVLAIIASLTGLFKGDTNKKVAATNSSTTSPSAPKGAE